MWAAVASCGLVVGFAMSGIITAYLGWRWIFLISVPFILVVVVAALFLRDNDRPEKRSPGRLDLPGAVLLTACPLLFTFGVVEAGEAGASLWLSAAALVGAVLAGVGFVRVEARSANPLVPLGFFGDRARVSANLTTVLLSAALSTSFLLFTFYLQDHLGIGPLGSGLLMLPLAGALILASVLVPRFLTRWGARTCVLTGLGSAACAMVVVSLVAFLDAGAAWLLPAMALIAAGMGFGIVGLQYVAVGGTTDEDAGIASGVQGAADQLGGASGVALYVGIGFAPALHSADPFIIAALLAVAGLGVGALIAQRVPGREIAQQAPV